MQWDSTLDVGWDQWGERELNPPGLSSLEFPFGERPVRIGQEGLSLI